MKWIFEVLTLAIIIILMVIGLRTEVGRLTAYKKVRALPATTGAHQPAGTIQATHWFESGGYLDSLPDLRQPSTLTVMTFNIHHGAGTDGRLDLDRIARVIRMADADIVGLQEVDRCFSARSNREDQVSLLADKLDMYYVYGPAIRTAQTGQYGNAVLSRYPVTYSENVILPALRTGEDRAVLRADIRLGKGIISFFTTHLGLSAAERKWHQVIIQDLLLHVLNPVVLTGDFNAAAGDLMTFAGLKDVCWREPYASLVTFPAWNPQIGTPNGTGVRIDHILISDPMKVREVSVVPGIASDHLPLIAELSIDFP